MVTTLSMARLRRARVFALDDDRRCLDLLVRALLLDYDVLLFGAPDALIEAARRAPPDLVIVELRTASVPAVDFIHRLRTGARSRCPVLLCTDDVNSSEAMEALQAEVVAGIIVKPWHPDVLRQHVYSLLSAARFPELA
jgi:DNA-binding response OmpR family regulator